MVNQVKIARITHINENKSELLYINQKITKIFFVFKKRGNTRNVSVRNRVSIVFL